LKGKAVNKGKRQKVGLGSRIAARFAKVGLTKHLPQLRRQPPRPAKFGK